LAEDRKRGKDVQEKENTTTEKEMNLAKVLKG